MKKWKRDNFKKKCLNKHNMHAFLSQLKKISCKNTNQWLYPKCSSSCCIVIAVSQELILSLENIGEGYKLWFLLLEFNYLSNYGLFFNLSCLKMLL